MKAVLFILFGFLGFFNSYAQGFTVNHYNVDIYIQEEGYFDVVERYDLTFDIYKHGIYRNIITSYQFTDSEGVTQKRKIRIRNIDVPGHKFDAPSTFSQKLSNSVDIRIGDPDVTVIGPKQYEIRYRVYDAFIFEDDKIQFYWNTKPSGWYADFENIRFNIHVPSSVSLSDSNCFIYSGDMGATGISEDILPIFQGSVFSGSSRDGYISRSGQSVTVLINMPVGTVKEIKPFWPFWAQYGWTIIIGILISAFYMIWKRFGKDDRVVATTSYFPPEGIDPAMAGYLINDRSNTSDLTSLFAYWGSRGHLRVEDISEKGWFGKKDTKLIRLKPLPANTSKYEKTIFNGLFGSDTSSNSNEVLVSSFKNTFYTKMGKASSQLKKSAQIYYIAKSKKVQGVTYGVLILLTILLVFLGLFFWGIIPGILMGITSVVLIIMNFYMIKKNARGNEVLSELKGFKKFIKIAEANKLKMLLQEDPDYFENTMSYALAFGLFTGWASKFSALNVPPPKWYSSATHNSLSMNNFSKSFTGSMAGVTSNLVSSPSSSSSSGGGSSGGGFGGGGGGSW